MSLAHDEDNNGITSRDYQDQWLGNSEASDKWLARVINKMTEWLVVSKAYDIYGNN